LEFSEALLTFTRFRIFAGTQAIFFTSDDFVHDDDRIYLSVVRKGCLIFVVVSMLSNLSCRWVSGVHFELCSVDHRIKTE